VNEYIIVVQRGDLTCTHGPYQTEQEAADAAHALSVLEGGIVVRVYPLLAVEELAAPERSLAEIAVLIWTDSAMYGTGQMAPAEARECRPTSGVSCGIVVAEGPDYITLALDHFDGQSFRCINSYSKAQIQQIIRRSIEPEAPAEE
jgi:hypothetical protein